MKKQLALVATLLAVVALPNQLLSTPDVHAPLEHVDAAAAAHATGAADVHAAAKEGAEAVGGGRAATAVADARNVAVGATDGQAMKAQGLFEAGTTAAISNPRTNPFTLAFDSFGNAFASFGVAIGGVFGFGAAPATRQVYATTAAAAAWNNSLAALAAGKVVFFTTRSGHWKARTYLKSVPNSAAIQMVVTLAPATLTQTKISLRTVAEIKKYLEKVIGRYPRITMSASTSTGTIIVTFTGGITTLSGSGNTYPGGTVQPFVLAVQQAVAGLEL